MVPSRFVEVEYFWYVLVFGLLFFHLRRTILKLRCDPVFAPASRFHLLEAVILYIIAGGVPLGVFFVARVVDEGLHVQISPKPLLFLSAVGIVGIVHGFVDGKIQDIEKFKAVDSKRYIRLYPFLHALVFMVLYWAICFFVYILLGISYRMLTGE